MKWYDLTKDLNSIPYVEGGWDIKEGIDLYSLIILFMERLGHNVKRFKAEKTITDIDLLHDFIKLNS